MAAKRKFPDPRPLAPPRACGACGHDLADAPLNTPCPQCGWRPSIHCVSCGYDLAGLDEEGPCPECATPIAESLRGDGLAFCDPKFLHTLDRGLAMIRWSVAVILISWIAGIFLMLAISMIGLWSVPTWVEEVVFGGILLASLVLYVLGWWVVTTPDPRTLGSEPARAPAIARYGAVVVLAIVVVLLVLGHFLLQARQIIMPVLLVSLMAQHAAGSVCLCRLATRATNPLAMKYARHALVAIATLVITAAISTALDLFGIQSPRGQGGLTTVARLAIVLVRITMMISGIVAVARQFSVAGLLRDDLARFLAHARP
ncbi:MAG: hypothetical protein ACIAQU_12150, partial [Phycisphaerales bacterium JB064]